jgi:hypothetical protein
MIEYDEKAPGKNAAIFGLILLICGLGLALFGIFYTEQIGIVPFPRYIGFAFLGGVAAIFGVIMLLAGAFEYYGAKNRSNAQGQSYQSATHQPSDNWYCQNCGQTNSPTIFYCVKCGQKRQ